VLPIAQSLRLVDVDGVHADYLGVTPEATWADVDRRTLSGGRLSGTAIAFRPDRDRRGPLPVAALARVDAPGGREGRLVVVGDTDFATNLHLGVLGNRDLLLAVAELAVRADPYTSSRPRAPSLSTFSTLALTAHEASLLLWTTTLIPGALCAGIALVMLGRRRRA
jgi:hypothetical protein